jgi:type II secretory pathway pseudopilin PulG
MKPNRSLSGESGYVLLAVMLTLALMLIALSIEAPRIAQQIKRDKEEELVHRGRDYATAVKRFVHKNGGRYPLSIEQLEDTNHVRFLRKRYKDPITGEADWRLVHVGEAQINIPAPNIGLSPGNAIAPTSPGLGAGPNQPPSGIAQPIPPGGQPGQTAQPQPGSTGSLGSLTTTSIGNGQTVGGGQIIGVASVNKGQSIKEFNDKDHYDEWFFVYDLKLEQSGGTGVAIAAPRGATGSSTGASGDQTPASGSGQPAPSLTPTPPQLPN